MFPSMKELDSQVRLAEEEVMRSDQRLRGTAFALRQRWTARMPTLATLAASSAIALILLRTRRSPRMPERRLRAGWDRLPPPLIDFCIARGIAAMTALVAGMSAGRKAVPPATVSYVDLDRYAGLWYEIARLPMREESDCAGDVTACYERRGDSLLIVNRCTGRDGRLKSIAGRARVIDGRTNAKLRVSFAPRFLSVLPFVWADYWVLDLAHDYSRVMVGTPDRRHLWLMARKPSLSDAELSDFLSRAEEQGYNVGKIDYTCHTVTAALPQETAPTEASPAEVH